jgi:oligosaccharide amylase
MPRDIPIGNGHLLVNFDDRYHLRDIYFPHIGGRNHTGGHRFGLGVWVDGTFTWVHDSWQITMRYAEETLATDVTLTNEQLGLRIDCTDVVDFHEYVVVRKFVVTNQRDTQREVRLFFHNDFHIGGSEIGDTAYYDPSRRALIHYKDGRWFLMNGIAGDLPPGLEQWAVGKKESDGKEGTWRDAEDGVLSGSTVVQGAVDSVGGLSLMAQPRGSVTAWYWIACGFAHHDVSVVDSVVLDKGPQALLSRTEAYWRVWANAEHNRMDAIDPAVAALFRRSLLTIRTQIDHHGGIVAATDYDIATYARDTYAYVWPRDGALVAAALDDAGYEGTTRGFFEFLRRVQSPEGYWMHKFNTDFTLASSWHPWVRDGKRTLPIQEDETGLPLWALWRHFNRHRDVDFVTPFYKGMIRPAAEFMASYVAADGLPQPSYDLWEERWGVHAWTVAAVWAGLRAAARFFATFGDADDAHRMETASAQVKLAAERAFWCEDEQRFVRTLTPDADGGYTQDTTADISVLGLVLLGMFEPDDPRILSTAEHLHERLWVNTEVGGMARYERDQYQRVSDDPNVTGNPWFVCTLWLAQWQIARAKSLDELAEPAGLMRWVAARALPSGVLAEQVNPYNDEPLSVSPLTWSHAELVRTVLQYARKAAGFNRCPTCGQPLRGDAQHAAAHA